MLKNKHVVEIVSVAVIAFLIGTMLNVNLLTMAGKEEEDGSPPSWQVYVTDVNASALPDVWRVNATNLAVDEEGNLRVIQMNGEQNVTITGHVTKLITLADDESVGSGSYWTSGYISIDGYSKVTILSYINTHHNRLELWAICNGSEYKLESSKDFPAYWTKTYDVMSPQLMLKIYNDDIMRNYVTVHIYLMA